MKKTIIMIFSVFFLGLYNISCLKNKESSTSAIAIQVSNKTSYYRLCNSQWICKFSCNSNDISSVTFQDIPSRCKTLEARQSLKSIYDTYEHHEQREEIYEKIIYPIQESDTLHIISVDDKLLKDFDHIFSRPENRCPGHNCYACTSSCKESNASVFNPWLITKMGSNFIYQKDIEGDPEFAKLQWTGLIKNSKQEDTMSYEEASTACKEYNAKYSDWKLPSKENLKQAFKYGLDEELELSSEDSVWGDGEEIVPIEDTGNPFQAEKNYTICVRIYKNK